MFFPEQFFIFFAAVAQIGYDCEAEFFDLYGILFSLQKLEKVVDDSFLTDFDFVGLVKKGGVGKGFEALLSSFHISSVGQEFSQTEDSFFLLEVIFHMQNHIWQHW